MAFGFRQMRPLSRLPVSSDVGDVSADVRRLFDELVIVACEKDRPEPRPPAPASFHLVERDFGRFARAVRVHVAVDAAAATATLRDGELRIVLPKIPERRGRAIPVAISTEPTA
jgi:hypothetical protein